MKSSPGISQQLRTSLESTNRCQTSSSKANNSKKVLKSLRPAVPVRALHKDATTFESVSAKVAPMHAHNATSRTNCLLKCPLIRQSKRASDWDLCGGGSSRGTIWTTGFRDRECSVRFLYEERVHFPENVAPESTLRATFQYVVQ